VAEAGGIEAVIKNPQHPYTQELVGSIPLPNPSQRWIEGGDGLGTDAVESNIHQVKTGCKFATRCPHVMARCREAQPPLFQILTNQVAACNLYDSAPVMENDHLSEALQIRSLP
jgi:peptide/nickel transport system ATP-binding protein